MLLALLCAACGGEAQHGPHADGNPKPAETGGSGETTTHPQPTHSGAGDAGAPVDEGGAGLGDGGSFESGGANTGGQSAGGVDASGTGGADANAGAAGQPSGNDCDPITFEDPELERTVRALVQKPTGSLSAADVAALTDLTTESITSLKGVECLTALTSLDFGSLPPSHVTDLSPLAALNRLETLSLSRNPVTDLEPLGQLPKLQTLYMFKMPEPLDLAPLASAHALTFLNLDGDTVESLAPLGSVTTLRQLNLRNGVLVKPSSVSALFEVEDLDLTAVLTDVTPLAGLSKLKKLRVGHSPLTHFSSVVGLIKLQYLDVPQAGLTDISALGNLTQLQGLNAASNQISDVTPLGELPELNTVVLVGNQITDIAALAGNAGIGQGDSVLLEQNPLLCASAATHLQAMKDRGAAVSSDCP